MKKNKLLPPAWLLMAFLAGCTVDPVEVGTDGVLSGYAPVYGTLAAQNIELISARPIQNPGKIYVYGGYLLVGEKLKGIHVFDNSDPSSPASVGFIQMLGNTDMAIKDGILYADHAGNLVALSTNDFQTLEEKGRLPLNNWHKGVPPPSGYPFVCYDPSQGIVVDWKKIVSANFECYAH